MTDSLAGDVLFIFFCSLLIVVVVVVHWRIEIHGNSPFINDFYNIQLIIIDGVLRHSFVDETSSVCMSVCVSVDVSMNNSEHKQRAVHRKSSNAQLQLTHTHRYWRLASEWENTDNVKCSSVNNVMTSIYSHNIVPNKARCALTLTQYRVIEMNIWIEVNWPKYGSSLSLTDSVERNFDSNEVWNLWNHKKSINKQFLTDRPTKPRKWNKNIDTMHHKYFIFLHAQWHSRRRTYLMYALVCVMSIWDDSERKRMFKLYWRIRKLVSLVRLFSNVCSRSDGKLTIHLN